MMSKQAKMIENRVDKANVRYTEALTSNKALREQIDTLRRERVVFEQIYNKLEKDLGVKRKHIAGLVNEVSSQFTQKDKPVKSVNSTTANLKGPGGMLQAVKATKQRHAQDQTKARLVKKARVQYEKKGGQFSSADEMSNMFIE